MFFFFFLWKRKELLKKKFLCFLLKKLVLTKIDKSFKNLFRFWPFSVLLNANLNRNDLNLTGAYQSYYRTRNFLKSKKENPISFRIPHWNDTLLIQNYSPSLFRLIIKLSLNFNSPVWLSNLWRSKFIKYFPSFARNLN